MVEHTNPEKWSCDMCVYFYQYHDEELEAAAAFSWNSKVPDVVGECRYAPQHELVKQLEYWCGKFTLNRTHPKASFNGLYKNEYSQEDRAMKQLLDYYNERYYNGGK